MRKIRVELELEIADSHREDDIIDDDVLAEVLEGAEFSEGVESVRFIGWEDAE